MVEAKEIPADSTKTIIVYNVVEKDSKKISDETWRVFIGQLFSTISTIFALYEVGDGNQ